MADAIGFSKGHIWQIERNIAENPSLTVLKGLADHFGVTVDYLINNPAESKKVNPQVSRMHRDLQELAREDLNIIEDMMKSLKQRRGSSRSK